MRTTRALGITLATGALVVGGTTGAALAEQSTGFTICLAGVTQSYGPQYSLASFLADGATEGACPVQQTDAPDLPVPVASTVGQVLDPQRPDPGSSTQVPDAALPPAVAEAELPAARPEPSSVTVDVPPVLTTAGPLPDDALPRVTPEPGSSVTVPTQDPEHGAAATTAVDRPTREAHVAEPTGPEPATTAASVAASSAAAAPAASAPAASAPASPRTAAAPASARLAVTGSTGALPLLLAAAAATVTGLALLGASRVRRAGR